MQQIIKLYEILKSLNNTFFKNQPLISSFLNLQKPIKTIPFEQISVVTRLDKGALCAHEETV